MTERAVHTPTAGMLPRPTSTVTEQLYVGGVKHKRDMKFILLQLLFLIAPVESETIELFFYQDAKRKKFS